jgi:hypothetical protein
MPVQLNKTKRIVHSPTPENHILAGLEEQKEILLKIYENSKKTKRYILIGRVVSLVYLFLILGFFAMGLKILSPLLNQFNNIMMPYNDLIGNDELKNVDVDAVNDLLRQYQKK